MTEPVSTAQYFPWDGGAIFVGTAGVFPAHAHQAIQICFLFEARIRLDPAELSAWTWVTPAAAQPGQNPPSLLLGATQFLLANYSDHPLIQFYLALTGQAAPTGDPCPTLREFVLAHREQITKIVATRLVQPNEPARSAYRYPALLTAQRLGGRPLALIEIGPSAGLTLVPTDTPTTTAPCTASPPRHWS